MKKYLLLLLSLCVLSACASKNKYDTIDTKEEANSRNMSAGGAKGGKNNTVVVQDRVYFKFDSSEITTEARAILDVTAEWLLSDTTVNITIEGHADERGTREYNIALGQRRANAVKNYLVRKGVAGVRIKTISYGKERPEFVGSGESVWSKNRRAVTVVVE